MCKNCGVCDHEPVYNGEDSLDKAEQEPLFGKAIWILKKTI